ncbi:MAG: glucose 1-dehydrogenase [Rhodospirillaceae bacterium]|nr:glucose 1-dehydrogenase [Rhodospirillaceae bacterium]MBT6136446.1 glucose 1-dehydrogenase [Rhodospirillaceae bacterium]
MKAFDLTGKVAVVTGGNGGIGLGMAEGLAAAGANVMVVGRDVAKNESSVAKLKTLGVEAASFQADVTDKNAVEAMVAKTVEIFGRLDILINNAGTNIRQQPEEFTEAEWHTVLDTNLTSAFICSNAAYPEMKKAGGGKIINIGSMLSIFGASFSLAYAASKGGIVQMSRVHATAWAKDNIQVNSVLPGWINTELTRGARRDVADLNDRVLARTPAGRWGEPEDMSGIATFLASPASDFVTGAAIPVDGGFSVQI